MREGAVCLVFLFFFISPTKRAKKKKLFSWQGVTLCRRRSAADDQGTSNREKRSTYSEPESSIRVSGTTGLDRCGRSVKGDRVMSRFVFAGESEDYRQGREDLLAAELALKDQVERVAALRRALPPGMYAPDYVFREGPMDLSRNDPEEFRDVRLADLFTDGHDTLLVDHLMFAAQDEEPCVMCSMWADGYNA